MVPFIRFADSTISVSIGAPNVLGKGPDKEFLEILNNSKLCGNFGSRPVKLFELRSSDCNEDRSSNVIGRLPFI
jgi:hypothetical protein